MDWRLVTHDAVRFPLACFERLIVPMQRAAEAGAIRLHSQGLQTNPTSYSAQAAFQRSAETSSPCPARGLYGMLKFALDELRPLGNACEQGTRSGKWM